MLPSIKEIEENTTKNTDSKIELELQEVNKESLIEKRPKPKTKTPKWVKMCLPFCRRPPNVEIEDITEEDEIPETDETNTVATKESNSKKTSNESSDTNTSIFDVGAMTLGGLYFDNSYCPAGADIAELLIALGSLGMVSTFVSAWKASLHKNAIKNVKKLKLQDIDTPENQCRIMTKYSCVNWFQRLLTVSKLGVLGWLSTIIYTVYPKVNYQEPEQLPNPSSFSVNSLQTALAIPDTKILDPNNYCNVTLFRISFWFVTILLSLLGFLTVSFILFAPCSNIGSFLRPSTNTANSTKENDTSGQKGNRIQSNNDASNV